MTPVFDRAAYQRLLDEAKNGLLVINVWTPADLRRDAITGVPFARRVANVAYAAFSGSGKPPYCMACDARFERKRLPAVFVSVRPIREDASVGLISFMCERCTPDDWPAVQQKVTEAFRAGPIPDAEIVNIGPAGNA